MEGGARLEGEVATAGAKNAVLPVMAASLLSPEPLARCPIQPQVLSCQTAHRMRCPR